MVDSSWFCIFNTVFAGVVQEPEAAYQINQTQINFASAPLAGDQFCIVLGQALESILLQMKWVVLNLQNHLIMTTIYLDA